MEWGDLVAVYASLFVQCWEQYAVQQRNGSYWRVQEPVSLPLIEAHLRGCWTLGTYLLDAQSRCSFAVFDADSDDGLERLAQLSQELAGQGIASVLEASRRGGHLWVHLVEPTPGHEVRTWLLPFAVAYGVEFYPKQERVVPGGAGSLVRMPLGIHRRTGGWYPFVQVQQHGEIVPVGETVEACCAWTGLHVQRVAVPAGVGGGGDGLPVPVWQEQGLGVCGGAFIARPGRGSIRAWCRAQDIRAVIGRYVALNPQGVGSCPFKEHHHRGDLRPSFQVFGGRNPHWYCYTWGRAGDLLDFLCLYYGVTAQEAWERVQQGAVW